MKTIKDPMFQITALLGLFMVVAILGVLII